MHKKAKKHITRTLFSNLITELSLGLYLVLTTVSCKLAVKYSINEENRYRPDPCNDISCHPPIPLANSASSNPSDDGRKEDLHNLRMAAENGDVNRIALLINDPNNDVNVTCAGGKTALYCAAERNKVEVVQLLIKCGRADLNKKNYYGNTPLHVASNLGYFEIVKALLGADGILVNAKNHHGETALYIAWEEGYRAILELLWKDERTECDKFCSICRETICLDKSSLHITRCLHFFHSACMKQCQDNQINKNKTCPNCRQLIESIH